MLRVISVIPRDRSISILEVLGYRRHYSVDFPSRLLHLSGRRSGQESVVDAVVHLWELGLAFPLLFLHLLIRAGRAFCACVIGLGLFVELSLEVPPFILGFSILLQSTVETALMVGVVRLPKPRMVDAGLIFYFL